MDVRIGFRRKKRFDMAGIVYVVVGIVVVMFAALSVVNLNSES